MPLAAVGLLLGVERTLDAVPDLLAAPAHRAEQVQLMCEAVGVPGHGLAVKTTVLDALAHVKRRAVCTAQHVGVVWQRRGKAATRQSAVIEPFGDQLKPGGTAYNACRFE